MGRTSDARERLMEAASALLWEYSYGAVTIDAICERAGVKKGSFYYFFNSKSDLALVAIQAWWDERKKLIDELFRPEVPPLDRIRSYIDYVTQRQLDAYEENGQVLGCPLFTLGSEISTQDERIRGMLHGILNTCAGFFEQAIRDAQASGEIEGKDASTKSRLLWGFYEGTLTRARIENNPELIRSMTSDALELIRTHGARRQLVSA